MALLLQLGDPGWLSITNFDGPHHLELGPAEIQSNFSNKYLIDVAYIVGAQKDKGENTCKPNVMIQALAPDPRNLQTDHGGLDMSVLAYAEGVLLNTTYADVIGFPERLLRVSVNGDGLDS